VNFQHPIVKIGIQRGGQCGGKRVDAWKNPLGFGVQGAVLIRKRELLPKGRKGAREEKPDRGLFKRKLQGGKQTLFPKESRGLRIERA